MSAALDYTRAELMIVAAARALADRGSCFVGIGAPSTAANLARRLYTPGLVLIYESGTIGAKPARLPLSIGDDELAGTADAVVSVPEIFNYWLQAGRIDVGFLAAAQLDRYANINSTVIGPDYRRPRVRLPGAGGAPEIAASCREVPVGDGAHRTGPGLLVVLDGDQTAGPGEVVGRLDHQDQPGIVQGGGPASPAPRPARGDGTGTANSTAPRC